MARAGPTSIGELREGPLHAAVKRWYARPGDLVEQPVAGFVVDIVRGERLVEVQTAGFHRLRPKLAALLDTHAITVVHPVAAERRIVRVDEHGEILAVRRSPLRSRVLAVCAELVAFPTLLAHPNLAVEVLLCREEHVRGPAPTVRRGRRRDPGERRLTAVAGTAVIAGADDLAAHLPTDLPAEFTVRELAHAAALAPALARQVAYCARALGVFEPAGRRGRAPVYRRGAT